MMEKFRRKNEKVKVVPSDIWLEILHRIPAVDLLPLKAVCKTFHLLISDDLLIRLHLKELIKHPKSKRAIVTLIEPTTLQSRFIYDPYKPTVDVGYDGPGPRFDDWCKYICSKSNLWHLTVYSCSQRVIDSYHGLLLVDVCGYLLLCNPITRAYKFVPSIHGHWLSFRGWKIVYDDVSKQYKVFGLDQSGKNRISFYVFDVGDRDDREFHLRREITAMEVDGGITIVTELKECVLVNGNVYILIFALEELVTLASEAIWRTYIVSANVTTEEVKTRICLHTPPSTFMTSWLWYDFFAANGTFYIGRSIDPNYEHPHYELQLWVLEGVESESCNPNWKIERLIPIDIGDRSGLHKEIRVLGMFDGKLLIMIRSYQLPNKLCQYDLSSGKFENVTVTRGGNNSEIGKKDFALPRIIEHIDSLISP